VNLYPFAANRLDAPWALRIDQLLAQPRDVHMHGLRIDCTVVPPTILRR
jgi:hypothetical protein